MTRLLVDGAKSMEPWGKLAEAYGEHTSTPGGPSDADPANAHKFAAFLTELLNAAGLCHEQLASLCEWLGAWEPLVKDHPELFELFMRSILDARAGPIVDGVSEEDDEWVLRHMA